MIGVPIYYNLAFVQTENIGGMDAEILISLKKGHHPTADYRRKIREDAAPGLPGSQLLFPVRRHRHPGAELRPYLSAGRPDRGHGFQQVLWLCPEACAMPCARSREPPTCISTRCSTIRRCRWTWTGPRAASLGMSAARRGQHALISLSSSILVAPSFFLNPRNNVNYTVAVQIPPEQINSLNSLHSMPLTPPSAELSAAGDAARARRRFRRCPRRPSPTSRRSTTRVSPENINHYTVQRVLDVDADVEGRDLGSVAAEIEKKIDALKPLPPGTRITLRGQNEIMNQSFRSLGLGLILADRAGLLPDGGAVPVLARSLHHHDGRPRRACGHPLDACPDRDHDQCGVAHGLHHGSRDRHREFDPAGQFCQRHAGRERAVRRWRPSSRRARRGCVRS